ncbi:hypothetical protein Emag_001973 [Eimeria magna]
MQQHTPQDEAQFGLLETLWGGAGGLQGYFPLTKPFIPQQQYQQPQQQDDEQQQQQQQDEETDVAAAADSLEPLKQGSFFFLASLFFEEREAQQMSQHRRILRELDGVLVPLSGAVECISRLEAKCMRLRALREKLLLCSSGLQSALKHVLQRQAQAEAISKCIEQRLRRYTQLDVLKQQLQKPPVLAKAGLGSRQAVEVSAIANCLTQIEDSLQFFASHLTYRNAEANLCAYEALRTRCLSILLSAALHHMQYTEDLLQARLKEKQQQQQHQQQQQDGEQSLDLPILHVQFEVLMAPTRPVMQILKDKQSLGLSDAYQRTLEQLYEQYVNMRGRLLLPPLKKQLQLSLASSSQATTTASVQSNSSNCSSSNSSSSRVDVYMLVGRMQHLLLSSDTLPQAARTLVSRAFSVSALEIRLFASFSISAPHEAALRLLLEQVATSAYDELCPAVLACNGVEDLCDIRETLLLEMLAGGRTLGEDAVPLLQKLHQLVTDVQERLFFRLEVSVDEEIRGFRLSARHLNREWLLEQTYPTVLKALHLVLLLQQRSTRQQSEGGGFFGAATAEGDPFDAACSDVIAAVLASLQAAARVASAADLRFFAPAMPQDAPAAAAAAPDAADQAATKVEEARTTRREICCCCCCCCYCCYWSCSCCWFVSQRLVAGCSWRALHAPFAATAAAAALAKVAASFFQLLRLGGPSAAETQEQQQPAAAAAAAAASSSEAQEQQRGGFFGALLPRVSETTFNAAAAVQASLGAACRDFVAAAVALSVSVTLAARSRAEILALQPGSPERAAAIRALPSMQREAAASQPPAAAAAASSSSAAAAIPASAAAAAAKALSAKLHAFGAAAKSLLPPLVKLLLPCLTPEYLSEDAELFPSPHAAPNQEAHEEEALLNLLLRLLLLLLVYVMSLRLLLLLLLAVTDGVLVLLMLLLNLLPLLGVALREVDALLMKEAQFDAATLEAVEKLEKQIREAVRHAATEAFEEAREKRAAATAAAAAAGSGQVAPRPIQDSSNTNVDPTAKETSAQRLSEGANNADEGKAPEETDIPKETTAAAAAPAPAAAGAAAAAAAEAVVGSGVATPSTIKTLVKETRQMGGGFCPLELSGNTDSSSSSSSSRTSCWCCCCSVTVGVATETRPQPPSSVSWPPIDEENCVCLKCLKQESAA